MKGWCNVLDRFQITLAAARVNAGFTQDEAAKRLGVSKATIVNWEGGKSAPDITKARDLSALYGLPLEYIFFAD